MKEKIIALLTAKFAGTRKETLAQIARMMAMQATTEEEAIKAHLNRTAKTFYNENRDGLNISDRVWNLAKNSKKEMEIIIQNGIKEGKSADEIQRGIKDYLNEPEKLFRRVRNADTGEFEWSEAAKKYHPGQGIYRSAYKNAMRLARTEITAAYRDAEWESYQNNPLIIGYEIRLSNNHTTLKKGRPVPLKDICDTLAGVYPKSFKWTGWHPQCRCYMMPIQIHKDELQERIKMRNEGRLDEWKPKNVVTKPPKAFENWVRQNQERAKRWSDMPRFVRDNPQFVKTKFDVNTYSPEERKFTQSHKTQEAMKRVLDKLSKLYPNIPNTELAAIHHYTKSGGNYRQLNKQLEKGTITDFNLAARTLITQGLEKLPVCQGFVYRGMIIKREEFEGIFGDKGSIVQQNRFISSSKNIEIAFKFATWNDKMKRNEIQVIIEINSKNGRDISGISEKNGIFAPENQEEVLFRENTAFKIDDKEVTGNVVWLKLSEI